MNLSPRAAIAAAFGVGPLILLAGCGGTTATGARATIVNIEPTTYAELPPVTTTTTTTLPADFVPAEGTRSPIEQTYIVQAGDSLAAIAAKFDITLEALVNYNSFADGTNQLILPGDEILIPPDALVPGTASGSGSTGSDGTGTDSGDTDTGGDTETPDAGEGCVHVIAAGENPSRVASQYDITVDELRAANPGGVMNTFLIGAELTIPPNGNC